VRNGHEFPFAFMLAVQALGIKDRYIRPRRPQQNGKVERSHRIDQEEFWVAGDSIRSQRPPRASAPGKGTTTTNASHWLYKGELRPKSSPLSCPPPRANAGADYLSNDAQGRDQS